MMSGDSAAAMHQQQARPREQVRSPTLTSMCCSLQLRLRRASIFTLQSRTHTASFPTTRLFSASPSRRPHSAICLSTCCGAIRCVCLTRPKEFLSHSSDTHTHTQPSFTLAYLHQRAVNDNTHTVLSTIRRAMAPLHSNRKLSIRTKYSRSCSTSPSPSIANMPSSFSGSFFPNSSKSTFYGYL